MRWCDRHDVGYILGLAKNSVLLRHAEPWTTRAQERFEQTGGKQRLFGEFRYAAATWDRPRRVIVKAEHLCQGRNTRFIVTNLSGQPQALYDELYCQRGDMESRIKEQQLYLYADRTSCHEFPANQFRLMLSSAAYLLVEALRRMALKETDLAQAQVHTIRLKLFKVAARVCVSVRRIVFHLCSSYPWQELFRRVAAILRAHRRPDLEFG